MPSAATSSCSNFGWYGPGNGCEHFHNGIDIVAPCGTKVKAAGPGTVVYVGWNYADGADQPGSSCPPARNGSRAGTRMKGELVPVHVGTRVKAGQLVGYEASTGRSTGCHLHWMLARRRLRKTRACSSVDGSDRGPRFGPSPHGC